MSVFNESIVEDAALDYLRDIGYATEFGPNIAPDGPDPERQSFQDVYLWDRLVTAGLRLNPALPGEVVDEAIKRLERAETQNLIAENLRVWKLLVEGVPIEHRDDDGNLRTVPVRLIDFENPANNDLVAVNQFTIVEHKNRRPDIVVFVNGIPLGLLELKNLAAENATMKGAWNQIQTYQRDIPSVFTPNAVTVISDGGTAAMSAFSGSFEHTRRGRRSMAVRSLLTSRRLKS